MRLMCPLCGESDQLDAWPFIDDDGAAKLRLTCTSDSHADPVVVAYDDPDAPSPRQGRDGGSLADEIDLYPKLEAIVELLPGWVEHGVVEHLFAFEHPDDYRRLWREFGHIATHGVKKFTLSAYLARRLGDLTREGSVAHRTTSATGRWGYNGNDISAWADPSRTRGEVKSWEAWARDHDIDPEDWPANELLDDELLDDGGPIDRDHAVLLIRLTDGFDDSLDTAGLYERTRRWWILGPRRDHVEHVFTVHQGTVRACWKVDGWEPAPDPPAGQRPRWGFWGRPAPDMDDQYRGLDVSSYFPQGAQSPVRYVNVPTP